MFNSGFSQPEDLGILLKDIIEGGTIDATIMTDTFAERQKGRKCLVDEPKDKAVNLSAMEYVKNGRQGDYIQCDKDGNQTVFRACELRENAPAESALCHHVATATDIKANESNKRIYADTGKSPTLTTMGGGHREPKVFIGAVRGRYIVDGKRADHKVSSQKGITEQRLEINHSEKSNCLTTVQKDNVVVIDPPKYRKLTPKECMRLQGFPSWCIDKLLESGISNSQLYKMTGNGFAIPVITHNLKSLLATGWMSE